MGRAWLPLFVSAFGSRLLGRRAVGSNHNEENDPLAQLWVKMAKALAGFESGLPEGCDPWLPRSGRADPKLFLVLRMTRVRVASLDVCGACGRVNGSQYQVSSE